jgi:hypothetical protein
MGGVDGRAPPRQAGQPVDLEERARSVVAAGMTDHHHVIAGDDLDVGADQPSGTA